MPIVLVVAEPDLGVVMLMLALLVGADRAVRRPAALARLGLAAGALAVVAVANLHLLKAYQVDPADRVPAPVGRPARHRVQRGPVEDRHRLGRPASARACSTGQLVAGNFVPEQHTDFIFAVAGEELGFVGAL